MKRLIKILSVIMATIMFFSVFSAANPAIAAEIQEVEMTEENVADIDIEETKNSNEDESESEPEIIGEDETRRDETTKHFIMSDGSRKAVKYSQPVHYRENGKWVDIDNTLEYDNKSDEYSNKSNSFDVRFKEDFSDSDFFSIEKEGYILSWEYSNNKLSKYFVDSEVSEIAEPESKEEKFTHKHNGNIKYNNFENNCELEYIVTSTGVKENIILNKKTDKNEFSFNVTADGLMLVKNTNGSISANDENGEEIFYIPAPFMYDSKNAYSYDVSYNLKENNNGTYTITITADEEWLKDNERIYPVTIDPVIQTKRTKTEIEATFIASGSPNQNFNGVQDLYLGVESANYRICRTLFKFDLPVLQKSDMVVGGYLSLAQHSSNFYTDTMPDQEIDAHLVSSAWDASTVTWNTSPGYDTKALDYSYLKNNVNEWKSFDITKAVKGWYEGATNNGIMIKKAVETGSDADVAARGIFYSDSHKSNEGYFPYIVIDYRNNKGYEDYWTYTSFSAGGAVGSVNDYTGNAVVEIPLASSVSEIMPVSLSLVYNTYTAKQKYVSGKRSSFLTTPGRGWKLNIQETVLESTEYGLSEEDAKIYPYVYMDGDGTEHYFKKVTQKDENGNEVTVLEDEDNLGLTLDDVATTTYKYKITDKNDTQYLFNGKGNLGIIQDSNGNKIQIHFNDDRTKITKVTDGTGHTFSFTYHISDEGIETDYLEKITDNSGRETKLHLPGGYLDTVTYYDKSKISIVYEDAENLGKEDFEGLVSYLITSDGDGFNFDYTTKATGGRVRKMYEIGTAPETGKNVAGQIITFDRRLYNTTVIRSAGVDGFHYVNSYDTEAKIDTDTNDDGKLDGNDDIITTLQFDNSGKTISQQVSYGDGSEVGAGAYDYGNGSGNKNRVTDSATLGKNTVNLLTNPNAESLDGWAQVTSGTLTTQKTLTSDFQYTGKNSYKIKNTAIETNGANSYYRQSVTGTYKKDDYYTFSAFIKTSNLLKQGSTGNMGAYIKISAYDANGTELGSEYSQVLVSNTETGINNGWRRVSASIKIPAGTTKLTVYMCLRNATGEAYFDCMQLEKGEVPTAVNLLENSSFEKQNSNGTPSDWTTAGACDIITDKVTATEHKDGSKSIVINGNASLSKGYKQVVPVQPNENDTYIVSGWAKAHAVNSTFHSHYEKDGATITDEAANEILTNTNKKDDETVELVADTKFEIAVLVSYKKTDEQGVSTNVTQYKDPASFNTTVSGWQYAATPVSLKYTDGEKGYTYTPTSITVVPRYNKQVNCAYFDHIQLIKDAAQSYVYDDKGNLVSVTANAEQKNNMEYDGEDNLTEYKDAIGCTTTFEYQEKTHNLLSVKTPKGVTSKYTYNAKGQATVSETQNKAGELKIKTETGYTGADSASGVKAGAYVSYTSDEHGNRTTYTYDMPSGGLKTITDANGVKTTNNYYTYTDSAENVKTDYNKLASVSTGNSKVSYTYDGNRIKTITFGDNEKHETYSFTYDAYGNVTETKVGDIPLSTNTYGTRNGALQQSKYANNDIVAYEYDNSGRVIEELKSDNPNVLSDSDLIAWETPYLWSYSVDGTPRTHTDNENNLKYSYSYDSIGRLIRTDIQDTSTNGAVGSIEYGFNSRGHMTSLKSEIGGRLHAQAYSYSKITNSNGDIINNSLENGKDGLPTRYKISSKYYADYSYDSLNRLNLRSFSTTRPLYNNYIYYPSERNTDGSQVYRTNQLKYEIIDNTAYRYTYDNVGNITKIEKGSRTTPNSSEIAAGNYSVYREYSYDALGQLLTETSNGTTTTYTYDKLGNILTKSSDEAAVNYTYGEYSGTGWKYLLTGIQTTTNDENGNPTTITESIAYDKVGNPTNYRGASMSWFGRQLTSYSKGDVSATFTYDADGLRGSKTVNGSKTTYFYVGDQLMYECRGDGKELYFYYDSYGNLSAIRYISSIGDYYYFVTTNKQGDVLGLYSENGNLKVSYEYDAWGNCTVKDAAGNAITSTVHIGNVNPIRYRGYYYDNDLGLYYLQSRYYDATIGRFINADGYVTTGQGILGFNMYAYCMNNPVMFSDLTGCMGVLTFLAGVVVIAVILIVPSSERIEATPEQIKSAEDAANRADVNVRNDDNEKPYTVDIKIDTQDAIDSVDEIAKDYYYDSLYDKTIEKANQYSVPSGNLMSKWHIRWEFELHTVAYAMGIENAIVTDLNFEETPWSMFKRAIGW